MNPKCLRCGQDGHFAQESKLPVLPDDRVLAVPLLSVMEAIHIGAKHSTGLSHTREFTEDGFLACVAEIEQAVRSKLGAMVPMTDQQISRLYAESWSTSSGAAFHQAVRAAEKFHGIVDKEGGK